MRDGRTAAQARITRLRDRITAGGERVGYALYRCDNRTDTERAGDRARGALAGCLVVVLPGHGQRAYPSVSLVGQSALRGLAGVAWLVDIDPPAGGDPVKAQALRAILYRHWPALGAGEQPPAGGVVVFGWSHGGGEALQAAAVAPELLHAVVGLCPVGLLARSPRELVLSFLYESLRVIVAVLKQGWAASWHAALVGVDTFIGIGADLLRTCSLRRIVSDVRWAARKVTGPDFQYGGVIGLVFAAGDTVVRWRDVFPGCSTPADIAVALPAYRQAEFPCVSELAVRVLPGNHLSPGMSQEYALTALVLAGQLLASEE